MTEPPGELTHLLREWQAGSAAAGERIVPLVYEQLQDIASKLFRRERPGHTLEPSAVVHEAYLRLGIERQTIRSRHHFFALAATAMRRVLVDHARARAREKRGGDWERTTLVDVSEAGGDSLVDVLALEEALDALARRDPRKARIVELRFYGGLTVAEAAEALDFSPRTARREWTLARRWLRHRLSGDLTPG